jgi:hypothetical protein
VGAAAIIAGSIALGIGASRQHRARHARRRRAVAAPAYAATAVFAAQRSPMRRVALLSNRGIDIWVLYARWVPYLVAERVEIVVALDWTDFDADQQSTLAAYLVTSHGRATPLMWKTMEKSELRDQRNDHEDALLCRLCEVMPPNVHVTILADRGFGDQKLCELLGNLDFDFVIRFRGAIVVGDGKGESKPASEWVSPKGRPKRLLAAGVRQDRCVVQQVVCVKAPRMKDAWCVASSLGDFTARDAHAIGRQGQPRETILKPNALKFVGDALVVMGFAASRISIYRDRV